MIIRELLKTAQKTELRVGELYRHMVKSFADYPEMSKMLAMLAEQEVMHAKMVEQMLDESSSPEAEVSIDGKIFSVFLETIDDVEDEVCERGIKVKDALEIAIHLEQSVAEEFYQRIPQTASGIPSHLVERMVNTCKVHLRELKKFRAHCLSQLSEDD